MRLRISRKLIRTVTGKAFFDIGHALKDQSNRRSHQPGYAAWEIHPVMTYHACEKSAHLSAIDARIDYRRSFRHVIADLLDEFLNWDSEFFATIDLLLVRPWNLTNQFLAGICLPPGLFSSTCTRLGSTLTISGERNAQRWR
jgi:hypothetical protein